MAVARGLHSNVVLNLTAREAVALAHVVRATQTTDTDAARAIAKVLDAADRAQIPWAERR